MTSCSVVRLDEVRKDRRFQEIGERLKDVIYDLFQEICEGMKTSTPTLFDLATAVFNRRQEVTEAVLKELVEERYAEAQKQEVMVCPGCDRALLSRGPSQRELETMVGTVRVSRPYFYCLHCQKGYHPLDEKLGLSEHHKQADIQEKIVSLTKEVPYDTACELFKELTGVKVGTHAAHEITEEIGSDLGVLEVSPSREEILKKIEEESEGRTWRPVGVLAIDGGMVPTRPEEARGGRGGRKKKRANRAFWEGEWHEAKGFRLYIVGKGGQIVHLISWHQVQDDKGIYEALQKAKGAGLIPEDRIRLSVLADGARWIWQQAKELFPTARHILDYYHCSEHVHETGEIQYANREEEGLEWVEATMALLFCGEVDSVIQGLEKMQPENAESQKAIDGLATYLRNNRDRIDYKKARRGGYSIGSGGIESANKFISHVRLKRSGAWWYVPNANHILALRCAKYNGTFTRVCRRERTAGQDRKK